MSEMVGTTVVGKAALRFARISPKKVRQITRYIQGKKVEEALGVLQFSRRKGAKILQKVLHSAVANSLQTGDVDEKTLFVQNALIDEGPRWKRTKIRAKGAASLMRKKTSHVTVVLGSKPASSSSVEVVERKQKKGEERIKTKVE